MSDLVDEYKSKFCECSERTLKLTQELVEARAALRTVAERQRRLCAAQARFYADLGVDADMMEEKVCATPLVTEEKP